MLTARCTVFFQSAAVSPGGVRCFVHSVVASARHQAQVPDGK